ncbi:methyltransferase family protein [Emcibacter sp.]|uniref:methyltransferase family protein n=1 Tax=Emcibacter sp. TaxID=1979954 RepID=UPI003A90E8F7
MSEFNQIQDEAKTGTGFAVKAFALISYTAFTLLFAYYAFYLAGSLVPVHVDNIRPAPMPEMLAVNIGLVMLFAVQHTIMASQGYKAWFASQFNPVWERPVFVAVSTFTFFILMWQWRSHPLEIWHMEAGWAVALMWGLYVAGWLIMLISTHLIDHWHLFGIKQALNGLAASAPDQDQGFVTPLFYNLVRHPMMTGTVMLLWATPYMTLGHLVLSAALTIYIMVGIRLEARKLIEELGGEYEQYHRTMPALFPGLKVWRK